VQRQVRLNDVNVCHYFGRSRFEKVNQGWSEGVWQHFRERLRKKNIICVWPVKITSFLYINTAGVKINNRINPGKPQNQPHRLLGGNSIALKQRFLNFFSPFGVSHCYSRLTQSDNQTKKTTIYLPLPRFSTICRYHAPAPLANLSLPLV